MIAKPRPRGSRGRRRRRRGSGRSAGDQGRQEGREASSNRRRRPPDAARRSLRSRTVRSMAGLRLIVGLGNPGAEYARTRHNAGFWFVDALAAARGGALRAGIASCSARPRRSTIAGQTGLAAQAGDLHEPLRQVGRPRRCATGRSSRRRCLVAHDELDLPPGAARLKFDGGHGGQNGLRDIMRAARPRQVPSPAHRHRPSRPQGPRHPLGARASRAGTTRPRSCAPSTTRIDVLPLAVAGDINEAMKRLHTRAMGLGIRDASRAHAHRRIPDLESRASSWASNAASSACRTSASRPSSTR